MKILASATTITCAGFLFAGCASSMAPSQFNESMPKATSSKFYERASLGAAISDGQCQVVIANRKYTAPVGMTLSGDVKNAARGIDEWVKSDGGNGYSISNYEWIHVGNEGATQLIVYFDTLRCK